MPIYDYFQILLCHVDSTHPICFYLYFKIQKTKLILSASRVIDISSKKGLAKLPSEFSFAHSHAHAWVARINYACSARLHSFDCLERKGEKM
jgi:hypothetical protein